MSGWEGGGGEGVGPQNRSSPKVALCSEKQLCRTDRFGGGDGVP